MKKSRSRSISCELVGVCIQTSANYVAHCMSASRSISGRAPRCSSHTDGCSPTSRFLCLALPRSSSSLALPLKIVSLVLCSQLPSLPVLLAACTPRRSPARTRPPSIRTDDYAIDNNPLAHMLSTMAPRSALSVLQCDRGAACRAAALCAAAPPAVLRFVRIHLVQQSASVFNVKVRHSSCFAVPLLLGGTNTDKSTSKAGAMAVITHSMYIHCKQLCT